MRWLRRATSAWSTSVAPRLSDVPDPGATRSGHRGQVLSIAFRACTRWGQVLSRHRVKPCLLPSARLRSTMNHVSSLAHRIPPAPFITSPPAVTAVSRFTSTRAGRTRAQRAARSPARAAAGADASVIQEDEASRLEAVPRRLRRQPRRGAAAWLPRARHDDDGVGAGRGLVGFAREPGDCGGGGRRARLTESPGESGARNARS